MLKKRFFQTGFSLIELMVGLTVGLIVSAGAGALYLLNVQTQTQSLRSVRLNQDIRAAMDLIVQDIRRAGYWAGSNRSSLTMTAGNSQPYTLSTTNINILNNGTCVMYSYDADADSSASVEAGEIFGFRLNGNSIEMLDPNNTLNSTSNCTFSSSSDDWSTFALELTSSDTIIIDAMNFRSKNSQCLNAQKNISWKVTSSNSTSNACSASSSEITMNSGATYAATTTLDLMMETRELEIMIRGHHSGDAATAVTVTETVHIPNNRIFYAP